MKARTIKLALLIACAMPALWGLLVPSVAEAHLLECEKTVNGQQIYTIESLFGPVDLNYRLVVRNPLTDESSTVRGLGDPIAEILGVPLPPTWFHLAPGEERVIEYTVTLPCASKCYLYDLKDGVKDGSIVNTFTVVWPEGFESCYAVVECPELPFGTCEEDE